MTRGVRCLFNGVFLYSITLFLFLQFWVIILKQAVFILYFLALSISSFSVTLSLFLGSYRHIFFIQLLSIKKRTLFYSGITFFNTGFRFSYSHLYAGHWKINIIVIMMIIFHDNQNMITHIWLQYYPSVTLINRWYHLITSFILFNASYIKILAWPLPRSVYIYFWVYVCVYT